MLDNHTTTVSPARNSSLTYVQKVTLPKKATVPELDTKSEIRDILQSNFVYQEEVTGKGPEGERVRIDFWCYPKPKILEQGWPARWFGIEAKSHGLQDQRKKSAARLVYQASRYSLSQFPTESGSSLPDFVLIYPCIERLMDGGDDDTAFRDGFIFGLTKEAGLFRVGELKIHGSDFEVVFHGINPWYHSRWGKNRADCLGARTTHASR